MTNKSIQIAAAIDKLVKPSNKLVMIDGIDGTAKSTIVKVLSQCPGYQLAPCDNGKTKERNDEEQWQSNVLIPLAKNFDGCTLLYRSWVSNIVYSQLNSRPCNFSKQSRLMAELFSELNALLIFIEAPKALLKSGYQEYSAENYNKLANLYKKQYNCWPNTAIIADTQQY